MKKTKILIHIYSLIQDIDYIERTLLFLKQNSLYVDRSQFYYLLDVTIPISDYWADWENSNIPKELFEDKFKNLQKYADWFDETSFKIEYDSKGALRNSVANMHKYDVDAIIYLDADILFNQYTLQIMSESFLSIKQHHSKFVITPELVKLWDNSWDILVNENFKNKSNDPFYVYQQDPILDSSQIYGDITLEPLQQNNRNIFKFGGGWFTLFSKELIDEMELPEDLEGFGAIDTIMMYYLNNHPSAIQFKIKNLVVCEDFKYMNRKTYNPYVQFINRKEDFYQENWNKLTAHFQNQLNNVSKFK
jgi:hypothetical protein